MNVFDLVATLRLDSSEYNEELGNSKSALSSFGSAAASGLATAAKLTAAGVTAAAGATTALTKSAVEGYADYQQLVGGVETLFGQGGNTLEEYAKTVRATARDIEESGIDWDKYMNTAWMSEGGGIQSIFEEIQYNIDELGASSQELEDYLHFEYDLDVEDAKAAIQSYYDAISDDTIRAKYEAAGRAQEAVMQHAAEAYKTAGLSANDYMETVTSFSASLLQSLGGDTEEAARVADMAIIDMADNANKMGSSMESIQNAYQGFAKQNYTMLDNLKLGYGGTKEEMERLLTDAEALSGVEYDMSNLNDVYEAIHVIQESMGIAGTTAKEGASTISGSLGMVSSSWKNLVVGIANGNADMSKLINNFVSSIKSAAGNILPQISQALDGVGKLVTGLAPVIVEAIPVVVNEVLPSLLESGATLVTTLLEGLSSQSDQVANGAVMIMTLLITTISENLPLIIEAAISIITNLAEGLANQIPTLIPVIINAVITIVNTLIQNAPKLLQAALTIIMALANGLIDYLPQLIAQLPTIISSIVSSLVGMSGQILASGGELIIALGKGLIQAIPQLILNLPQIIASIVSGLLEGIGDMAGVGLELVKGLWNGISDAADWVIDKIKGFGEKILSGIKSFFGIHSPSTVFAEIGDYMAQGLAVGWDDSVGDVIDQMNEDMDLEGNAVMNLSAGEVDSFETEGIAASGLSLAGMGDIIIPVYIGQTRLDEVIISNEQIRNYRSGGR